MKTELFITLKVPDNVAMSASLALKRMGYQELKNLDRKEYFIFEHSEDEKKFKNKIKEIDILVNANKHIPSFELKNDKNTMHILVQDAEKSTALKDKLTKNFNLKLTKANSGTVWSMQFEEGTDAKQKTKEITEKLLMNEHYQKYTIL